MFLSEIPHLLRENEMESEEYIRIKKKDAIEMIRDISIIIVSLDRIGSYGSRIDEQTLNNIIAEFIITWSACPKLARIRTIISDEFSDELGPDDMDELERALEGTPYWSWNNREPPSPNL
jgi:hypothetical protein